MLRLLWAWLEDAWHGWNQFWFTPRATQTLSLIRICTGLMLLYTHLVWGLRFEAFFGERPWLPKEFVLALPGNRFAWSHFFWLDQPLLLRGLHLAALGAFACLTLGFYTRAAAIVSALFAISYVHRLPGALFGLDQLNVLLASYLAVAGRQSVLSVDAWRMRKQGLVVPQQTVWANLATRLIQIHMCIIYLFAGMAKLQGPAWWNGEAMWGAIAIQEYQSLDLTFLVRFPALISLLTFVTVYWELSYVALVWPRWSRPLVLLLAIPLHMGIAVALGMITFGLIMLVGNLSFVPPQWLKGLLRTDSP